MNDAPSRKITGLAPTRQPDLSRLMEKNRAAAPVALVPPLSAPSTTEQPAPPPQLAAPTEAAAPPAQAVPEATHTAAPSKPARKAAEQPERTDERKVPATVYLPESVSQRARAAWRATGHLEGEESWSDFVGTAVLKELQLREKKHNAGEPFAAVGRLRAGRPLKN